MPVQFHPNNPIDALESIIVKEDGSPLRGEINIYRKLWEDLSKSEIVSFTKLLACSIKNLF